MATLITLTRRGTNVPVLVNPDQISFVEEFADGGCQVFLGDGPAPYVAESLSEIRLLVASNDCARIAAKDFGKTAYESSRCTEIVLTQKAIDLIGQQINIPQVGHDRTASIKIDAIFGFHAYVPSDTAMPYLSISAKQGRNPIQIVILDVTPETATALERAAQLVRGFIATQEPKQ